MLLSRPRSPSPNAPQPSPKTTAPLEVSRYAPEGEVALAPALSVTFSQPMVAVTSQEETAASVPVILTPQPKGRWRWLGTRTLVFQPETEGGRLPMATNYTVTIPAGTRSALGNALPEAEAFTFATPPPTLQNTYPKGLSQPRDALMFLEFDQRIDAARVLEGIRLQSAMSGTFLRLATPDEISADPSIKDLVKQSQEGRWIAFRAVTSNGSTKDALPADTNIQIVIPPGTPSKEGPRTTVTEQSMVPFRTYGAMRVTETQCGFEKRCSPFDRFHITFSNQLDLENTPASKATVTPQIPDSSDAPGGPGSPLSPLSPFSPLAPLQTYRLPLALVSKNPPAAQFGPGGIAMTVTDCPGSPFAPFCPAGPTGPAGPLGPAGPAGPAILQLSATSGGLHSLSESTLRSWPLFF